MITTIDQVKNDRRSTLIGVMFVQTPQGCMDIQLWIDRDGWLWVQYPDTSKRVYDCSDSIQDTELRGRIASYFSNHIGKSTNVLQGDDKLGIAIILYRLEVEAPECLPIYGRRY